MGIFKNDKFNILSKSMDIEELVKIEEESPIESTDPQLKEQYYFAHFYADDSNELPNNQNESIKI